ncbi:MAG: hypothetical protein WDA20_14130 [Desulfuromonadales bacterium]
MEDLWKLRNLGYRLNELAEKAEYDRLVKRFREEEVSGNARNLLYGPGALAAPDSRKNEKKSS